MNTESATLLVIVLLCATLVASIAGWAPFGRTVWPPVALALLAATAVAAAVPGSLDTDGRQVTTLVVILTGALAVVGGGPVTTLVFSLVDSTGTSEGSQAHTIDAAGRALRGGAWIGALERAAILASLAVGLPEGVAVVLGLKGLGRYPELRNPEESPGAAERFIIGTFTSVLWAAACAGVVALILR